MSITPEYHSDNPAALAFPYANAMVKNHFLDGFYATNAQEQLELDALEAKADLIGFLGKRYIVHSGRSITIPAFSEAWDFVTYSDFEEGLDFSGDLVSYGTVRIEKMWVDRSIGDSAIRALCLTFDNVKTLPFLKDIESDHLLYTPVFAVNDIQEVRSA